MTPDSQIRITRGWIVVALFAAATGVFSGCGGNPAYFSRGIDTLEAPRTLALMPLVNLSRTEQAADVVEGQLVVDIMGSRTFDVVDPGAVEAAVVENRLRLTDRLPLETIRALGERLNVRYLMMGTINEFGLEQARDEQIPVVSISIRIVTCADGRIVWAASHSRRGDDNETIFGIGSVHSLEQLAEATVREITDTLKQQGQSK